MSRTYSDNGRIYSVDMMFAYINIFKPQYKYVELKSLIKNLNFKGWRTEHNEIYSPIDVLNNPKKYKKDMERINQADLSYPIIIHKNNQIVDGVHRLTKAYLAGMKKIKAYVFKPQMMKQFLIKEEYPAWHLIQLFHNRFEN